MLVLIDYQPGFSFFLHHPADQVIQVIKSAKQTLLQAIAQQEPIVVLEYENLAVEDQTRGETSPFIKNPLKDYPNVIFMEKDTFSGAAQVLDACQQLGVSPNLFKVCGIYFQFCVWETVRDLHQLTGTPIQVITDACNPDPLLDYVDGRLQNNLPPLSKTTQFLQLERVTLTQSCPNHDL